jgi:hypothetical protein
LHGKRAVSAKKEGHRRSSCCGRIKIVIAVHKHSDTDKDAYGVFGRSVAMQLKKLSEESALFAQCRIQNILTEMGIEDFRRRNHSTSTSYSNPASIVSLSPGNESPMTQSNMLSGSTNFVPYDFNENDLVHTALFNTFSSTNE